MAAFLPRDGHSSGTSVAGRLTQPTRAAGVETVPELLAPRRPYSVLLPVGFTMPDPVAGSAVGSYPTLSPLPCAPQHELPRQAVCFLWHFPWGCPRRALPGTVSPWSPDFPPRQPFSICRSGRPASWRAGYGLALPPWSTPRRESGDEPVEGFDRRAVRHPVNPIGPEVALEGGYHRLQLVVEFSSIGKAVTIFAGILA